MARAASAPVRSCRICRSKRLKGELTRWVRVGGAWTLDAGQRMEGRGFYTCSDECAEKLTKKPVTSTR